MPCLVNEPFPPMRFKLHESNNQRYFIRLTVGVFPNQDQGSDEVSIKKDQTQATAALNERHSCAFLLLSAPAVLSAVYF